MNVSPCPVEAIRTAGNWPALAAEYAEETLLAGMPEPNPDWAAYARMEAAGALHAFGAAVDGCLVGFLSIIVTPMPRYSRVMALSESFFVLKAWRHTGAGLKLLSAAENKARHLKALSLSITTVSEGDLAKVLPRRGYSEAARTFVKVLT